jgi:dihydrofolate reductase
VRKIVASTGVALDGVTEAPEDWFFQFWSDELSKWTHDELLQSDALLLGRVTYEAFAEFWPTATNEPGIGMLRTRGGRQDGRWTEVASPAFGPRSHQGLKRDG